MIKKKDADDKINDEGIMAKMKTKKKKYHVDNKEGDNNNYKKEEVFNKVSD